MVQVVTPQDDDTGTDSSTSHEALDDRLIIQAVRSGDREAFAALYRRDVDAARRHARTLTTSPAEADDMVHEAFTKTLAALLAGDGPQRAFRAYLLTAVRRLAYDKTRRARKLHFVDDVEGLLETRPEAAVPFTDPAVSGMERDFAAVAFASLPPRWQAALWHKHIEGMNPAQIATLLGLATSNGASALVNRARTGLRTAFLQTHAGNRHTYASCRDAKPRLGAWARNQLSRRDRLRIDRHLSWCVDCATVARRLSEINRELPA